MGLTRFPRGVSSFGMPVLGSGGIVTTGKVFFVHNSTGNDGNDGTSPDAPVKTLDYAVGLCTASQGDHIIIMEGSNESVSSTIAVDVAGVTIIALGHGQARGMLTQATTGSDNVMEISADNVHIENIYFKGSTTGTSETFINIKSVDNVVLERCVFEQNTKNLIAVLVDTGTDYLTIDGCQFTGVAAGADNGIKFKVLTTSAGATVYLNPVIKNCLFNYTGSAGVDEGAICVSISSGGMAGVLIQDCTFLGLADGERAINPKGTTATACTGLVDRVSVLTADKTDAFIVTNVLGYIQTWATEAGKRTSTYGSGTSPVATAAA